MTINRQRYKVSYVQITHYGVTRHNRSEYGLLFINERLLRDELIFVTIQEQGNISLKNFEALASEFLENLEDMFPGTTCINEQRLNTVNTVNMVNTVNTLSTIRTEETFLLDFLK